MTTRSNFRRLFDQGDKLRLVTEDKPGQERTTNLTAPGLQELVNTASKQGYWPPLVVWAEGWMRERYENAASEDEDDGEKWAYMSPGQRAEFVEEQGALLSDLLEQALEHYQYEAIPDLRED